jgi:osmotically-inducible protein OsmY
VAGGERSADEIQRDIEKSRVALAEAVDQLAYRTNPKRVSDNVKQSLREKAQSTQGRIVIGVAGGVVVLLIIKRFRKR